MTEHHNVAIIGSGFAGIGMAIKLRQAGHEDVVILERADDLGGTWRDNTYPGCQCDVQSHLYSYSFAPNPDWSRTYAPQNEIWGYLRDCAQRFEIESLIRYGNEVCDCRWDADGQRWVIETSRAKLTADILVAGVGALSAASVPEIDGLDGFGGAVFHSSQWRHDQDMAGRRVASIGTGASAIQYVPAIQPDVESLHVFQRTPAWVLPRPDRAIQPGVQEIYRRFPLGQKLVRSLIYWTRELIAVGMTQRPELLRGLERLAIKHLENQIDDAGLRAQLTPDYALGCKRILLSNDYYPALAADNVEVVTDGIDHVTEDAIVTGDGVRREVDTIILGTGFEVTTHPAFERIHGRDARSLAEHWSNGMQAYLGTTVPGFPNLFIMTGPNTGLGHSSMVFMMESQFAYVLDCVRTMARRDLSAVDVRPEVLEAYGEEIDARLASTIWSSGCASWYLDANGRNTTLWPGYTFQYRMRTRRFDSTDYELTPRAKRSPSVGAERVG